MRIEIGDCQYDKNGFPTLGHHRAVVEAITNRGKGPQGESEQEWLARWRAEHNRHYLEIIARLQNDRLDPKNMVAAHALLVGADLRRADLRGANLRGMTLTNANFRGADCEGADFTGATLIKCDFSRSCLRLAKFEDADLSGSDMSMAYMKAASFLDAKMWRVWLRHAMAESAQFFGTDMTFCDVRYADFWGARFDGAITDHVAHKDKASFVRWYNQATGEWALEPAEGFVVVSRNFTGAMSFQGNSARRADG